jgi:hypothetical protein
LNDLKERREYSHLKEKALYRTTWRAGFGRGFGPVVRQTAKGMNCTITVGSHFRGRWMGSRRPIEGFPPSLILTARDLFGRAGLSRISNDKIHENKMTWKKTLEILLTTVPLDF